MNMKANDVNKTGKTYEIYKTYKMNKITEVPVRMPAWRRRTVFGAVLAALCASVVLVTGCGSAEAVKEAADTAPVSQETPKWEPIPENAPAPSAAEGVNQAAEDAQAMEDAQTPDEDQGQNQTQAEQETKTDEAGTGEDMQTGTQPDAIGEQKEWIVPELTDPSDLGQQMAVFMAKNHLDSSNFSVSFCNLVSGQTYYFNELALLTPASTYKLPLNMYYYDLQAAGEITGDSIIPDTELTLAECHRRSLVESDNPSSEAMLSALDFIKFKQDIRKYFTLTDDQIDPVYYRRNFYSTRMMQETAAYLYRHADEYQEALGYLLQAQPGMYFRRYAGSCQIAQKYGRIDGWENCVGIVYAPTPFTLAVYTYGTGSDEVVARCCELLLNYVGTYG